MGGIHHGTTCQRARRALQAHAPDLADLELVQVGQGLNNTAYGAGDLVLRVADGLGVVREARLLEVLAPRLSIPIPAPRFADEAAGVMGYQRIPGRPLLGRDPPPGTGMRLGRFLRELHDLDPGVVADLVPSEDADPVEWLDDLAGPRDLLAIVNGTRPPASDERVVAHADLGAEHILELDGELTGIIDWSDAAISDPALDLARLYRDFGPRFLEDLLQTYGRLSPLAMGRVEFFARCAALEDLAFGQGTGRREYAANAERSVEWLFSHRSLIAGRPRSP